MTIVIVSNLERLIDAAEANGYRSSRPCRLDPNASDIVRHLAYSRAGYNPMAEADNDEFWSKCGIGDWQKLASEFKDFRHPRFFEDPVGKKELGTVVRRKCVGPLAFRDLDVAKKYYDEAFGFDTKLSLTRNVKDGFCQMYDPEGRFEIERMKTEFPYPEEYTFEMAMDWIERTSPFTHSFKGKYMNMEFRKEAYEEFMNSVRL